MDTQNVSAQLYFNQLPEDPAASIYNCQNTYPNLSTCTKDVITDTQIENAFQKQLNLSEYYKSPEVFDTMKRDFMDQTMQGEKVGPANIKELPQPRPVPTVIPVGPTDFLNRFIKESFGSTGSTIGIVIGMLLLLGAVVLFIYFIVWIIKTKDN